MAKEVMLFDASEIQNIVLSGSAVNAYNLALSHAGIEMDEGAQADFISYRNGNAEGFRELWEYKKKLEMLTASIKEVVEHAFNVGSWDDLPDEKGGPKISWSKQSYNYKWAAYGSSVEVVRTLSQKKICTVDTALCELTVDAVAKASGVDKMKLIDMFPEHIVTEPKKRTLSIK